MEQNESVPYNQIDHGHCWESKSPPCGQKIEHLKCCLCEKLNPKASPEPVESWRRSEHVAMNIVHQIGDLLYETLPPEVAHEHFVKARQATNDRAIDFTEKLIEKHLTSQKQKQIEEFIELLKENGSQQDDDTIWVNMDDIIAKLRG